MMMIEPQKNSFTNQNYEPPVRSSVKHKLKLLRENYVSDSFLMYAYKWSCRWKKKKKSVIEVSFNCESNGRAGFQCIVA